MQEHSVGQSLLLLESPTVHLAPGLSSRRDGSTAPSAGEN